MPYLLDTDWLIAILRGDGGRVERLEKLIAGDEVSISVITLAELWEGVPMENPEAPECIALRGLLLPMSVLPVDKEVAMTFANARRRLRKDGRLIPDLDLFIGATALVNHLTLLTRNRSHFERIPGLALGDIE